MPFLSLTRLRLRSVRFLPVFALYTIRCNRQVKRSGGFLGGSLLPDRKLTFWTLTMWDREEAMRAYMVSGAHKEAMPHLMNWCDEASVTHWDQTEDNLPSWEEADRRMRASGRVSKVRFPSADHAGLTYREPRLTGSAPIRPVQVQNA